MNVALLTAGGIGTRMHNEIPKQFINIDDKPLIVYTMEKFQSHPSIDYICVVCLDGWHEILKAYAKQFGITKLKWVVSGGKNGQESKVECLCREGVCGTCETAILEGEADHRDQYFSDEERASQQSMLICCSRAKGKRLVLDL